MAFGTKYIIIIMALLSSYPRFNLRIYDVRKVFDFPSLKKDFRNLTVDPYVKEGFRKKHITRFKNTHTGLVKLPHTSLFQSIEINPTHGNIERIYPEYNSDNAIKFAHIFSIL